MSKARLLWIALTVPACSSFPSQGTTSATTAEEDPSFSNVEDGSVDQESDAGVPGEKPPPGQSPASSNDEGPDGEQQLSSEDDTGTPEDGTPDPVEPKSAPGERCTCDSDCQGTPKNPGLCLSGICGTRSTDDNCMDGATGPCPAGQRCWGERCYPDYVEGVCAGVEDEDGSCVHPPGELWCDPSCSSSCRDLWRSANRPDHPEGDPSDGSDCTAPNAGWGT